jgi:hypothetical protein
MRENWKIALILIMSVIAINLSLIFDVGFLSDDWDILKRIGDASIFSSVEQHHYSPFVSAIFKLTGYYEWSPAWIHLVAFFLHGVNIYLVLKLCGRMGLNTWEKWVTGTLFALSPAGFEALAWCCAIGYILCTTWILVALRLMVSARDEDFPFVSYRIAFLQVLAFITWDWGILLMPLVAVAKWLYREEKGFRGLVPGSVVWLLVVGLKKVLGFSYGYDLNPPLEAVKHVGASFMLTVWPEFSKTFYTSVWGMGLAAVTALVFFSFSLRDKVSRLGILLFIVSVLPVALIGYPQSRYVYLAAIFLYWGVARLSDKSHLAKGFALLYICAAVIWTVERRDVWIEADLQANFYRKNVEEALIHHEKVALANVPDQVSGYDLVWLPTVWRCGLECLQPNVIVMNPFGREEVVAEDLPENTYILKVGDRRKFRTVSR